MEAVGMTDYRRVVRIDGRPEVVSFDLSEVGSAGRILVTAQSDGGRSAMRHVVRRLFDLDPDIDAVERQLSRDPVLAPVVRQQRGLRIPGTTDSFELGVRAILGQQISVSRAASLAGKLARELGTRLPNSDGELWLAFPPPKELLDADLSFLRLPGRRAAAVHALARAVHEGTVTFDPDVSPEVIVERLESLPGVGPWTANYIALRALNFQDAFPSADLGLRAAISPSGGPVSERALRETAEAWRPFRGYAAVHLWTTLLPSARP
jgi:AraC family transcriptional regulator of adaptative response / DNA-3-methyladenine glycosylase II